MNAFRAALIAVLAGLLVWIAVTGYTWQFVPVTAAGVLIAFTLFFNRKSKRKILTCSAIFVLSGLTFALFWAFPLIRLPAPAGPQQVGVRYLTIRTERDETMTDESGDTRTLYLKIWYPASKTEGFERSPYIEGGRNTFAILLGNIGIPAFLFSHFGHIKTHGYLEAPVFAGRFPLLTFSHGFGSWFGQNTSLMEEMASQGFIVAAITHSHQSAVAASDANTIVTFPRIVPILSPQENSPNGEDYLLVKDTARYAALFYKDLVAKPQANQYARIWAEDIRSTLDVLLGPSEKEGGFLHGHIDTSRIGSFGMSFGGAASAEAALIDNRVKAAINMDGTQYGSWAADTLRVPFLFMERQRSPYLYSMYAPLKYRTTAPVYTLLFKNAGHYNFTDVSLYSPLFGYLGLTGSVRGKEMIRSLNAIVPDFFRSAFDGKAFRPDHYYSGEIIKPVY